MLVGKMRSVLRNNRQQCLKATFVRVAVAGAGAATGEEEEKRAAVRSYSEVN